MTDTRSHCSQSSGTHAELSEGTAKDRPGRRWLRAILWRLLWAAAAVSILAALIYWLAV